MDASIIKERRLALGLTQGDVADMARVSKRSVMRVEAGVVVQAATLRAICLSLDVTYAEPAKPVPTEHDGPRTPGHRTIPLASGRTSPHPLMVSFLDVLGKVPNLDLVVLPDTEAFRKYGKPGMREVVTGLNPVRAWRLLRLFARMDPLSVYMGTAYYITAVLVIAMALPPLGWYGLGAVPLTALAANMGRIAWQRLRHGKEMERLERTALGFAGKHLTVVEVYPEGVRLRKYAITERQVMRMRCGPSYTYLGVDLVGGDVILRALPNDPVVDSRLVDPNPFRSGVWLPRSGTVEAPPSGTSSVSPA